MKSCGVPPTVTTGDSVYAQSPEGSSNTTPTGTGRDVAAVSYKKWKLTDLPARLPDVPMKLPGAKVSTQTLLMTWEPTKSVPLSSPETIVPVTVS